jgi:hypothetical protein
VNFFYILVKINQFFYFLVIEFYKNFLNQIIKTIKKKLKIKEKLMPKPPAYNCFHICVIKINILFAFKY